MSPIRLNPSYCSVILALIVGSSAAIAQTSTQGSEQMKKAMASGMQSMQQMPMSGDTDKDFAMMMKMHHQQALDMAKAEVSNGKSSELKSMANKMIKDQSREIEKLDRWLQQHR